MKTISRYAGVMALMFFLVLCSNVLLAQPLPPPATAPVSGGLGFLLVASSIWGFKKFRDNRKSR